MSNLRAFLHIELGLPDNQASGVSNITWAFSLLLILAAGLRKRLEPQWIWALAVVSYLLFCSHVSSTDELVLLVVPPLVVPWKGRMARRSAYLPWAIVLAALFLSPALGPIVPLPRATLFFIEAGLGFWLVFQGLTHHPSRTS
ncbi:MAG: hypothetical protein HKO65_19265 [Gemmatimonadetes bacterium]|nr:hypothetical protein [Gemmatimonadota bacterium]